MQRRPWSAGKRAGRPRPQDQRRGNAGKPHPIQLTPEEERLIPVRTVQDLLASVWRQPWVRLLMYLLLAAVTLWFIRRLGSVLMTAAVAYGLAYLVNPALTWLEGRGVRRVVGMLLVTLISLMVLGLFSWVVTAQLVNLLNDLPQFITQLGTAVGDLLERLSGVPGLEHVQENFAVSLNEQARQLSTNLGPTIQRLLASGGTLLGGAASLASWFGQAAFVLILSLYFMLGYQRVGAGVLRVIPRSWRPTVQTLSEDVSVSFGGYLRGQLLIGLAVGLLIALGLSLLGIPNALAIGLLAALLNIVPYLGPVVAAVPALLLAVPGGWLTVLLVTAVFVAANQLESSLLSPYVLGKTTHLAPAAVLLAILAGLTLGGLVGALLAIPTVTLLRRWMERFWLTSPVHGLPDEDGS